MSLLTSKGFYGWTFSAVVFYLALPLILARLAGFSAEELGFRRGKKDGYILALLLFVLTLPVSFYASRMPSFRAYYPIFPYRSAWGFLMGEALIGISMFAHEAFYRGFLLFPLAKKNRWKGIIVQLIPYVLVHIGKPPLEIPYSLIGGIVFAEIDLRSESFLPSFLLHWAGAVVFDLMCAL